MIKMCSCLVVISVLFSPLAFGFDDKYAHPQLTEEAVGYSSILEEALKGQLGIRNGFDAELSNNRENLKIPVWFKRGAEKEDKPLCRANNHFHDPTKPWADAKLVDPIVGPWCFSFSPQYKTASSALLWATDPTLNNQFNPDAGNDEPNGRNWWVARELFYKALTESNTAERERYLAETFLTLGHVLHLLQDMAVPAHTRNDFSQGHIQGSGCPEKLCVDGLVT
jgi:hypothetical protein